MVSRGGQTPRISAAALPAECAALQAREQGVGQAYTHAPAVGAWPIPSPPPFIPASWPAWVFTRLSQQD